MIFSTTTITAKTTGANNDTIITIIVTTTTTGTRRRIAVCDYELLDPLDPDFKKEITTHLAIYNLEIDGSKTLYRHFLR